MLESFFSSFSSYILVLPLLFSRTMMTSIQEDRGATRTSPLRRSWYKLRRTRKKIKKGPWTIPYLPPTTPITVLFLFLFLFLSPRMSWASGPLPSTLFELAKLDLVTENPSKSEICGPIAADQRQKSSDWRQENADVGKRAIAGATWIYLIGTSGQKTAVLSKNAWTERCKDLKKKKKQNIVGVWTISLTAH